MYYTQTGSKLPLPCRHYQTGLYVCTRKYFHVHKKPVSLRNGFLEVPTRFELVIKVLQTFALPLGYGTIPSLIEE